MPDVPLVNDILHSGQLAYGKYGREFERELAEFFGTSHIIVTNTFNMSMLVALTTLGLKPGDTVIASPMACLASTQPLLSAGLKIRWADVNPETGTLCPDSVKDKLQYNPKVIIHNHFCGYVGFIDEINSLGREYGIPVIDDGIEAFGSEYQGKKIGNTDTDVTIFSFNPVRFPNTLDGGAVIFKDENMFNRSILVRDAGIDRSKFRDKNGEINSQCDIQIIGHSATPMELSSYLGIRQMYYINSILEQQRSNAAKWDTVISQLPRIEPIKVKGTLPNYWVYGILTSNKHDDLLFFRDKGFYVSSVHYKNNAYSVFDDKSNLPGVEKFFKSFLGLPCGWWVNCNEIVL